MIQGLHVYHHSVELALMVSHRGGDGAISAIICSVILVSLFIAYLTMDVVSVPYYNRRNSRNKGVVYDLEHESYHFQIQGFEYYAKCPLTWRPALRATGVWFLRPASRVGSIVASQIQRKSSGVADVVVVIKYHLGWSTRSRLVVSGINHKTHEMVSTELSQVGESYCTRVIYLGCVNEVSVFACIYCNCTCNKAKSKGLNNNCFEWHFLRYW